MSDNLADIYEPRFRAMLAPLSAHTRELLEPALRQALDAIEMLCPVALHVNRTGGHQSAYGPDVDEHTRFVVIAATPDAYATYTATEWPEPHPDPVASLLPPTLWMLMATAIRKGDPEAVPRLLATRMGPEGIAATEAMFATMRKNGLVPALVAMMATSGGDMACGMAGRFALPPRLMDQLPPG